MLFILISLFCDFTMPIQCVTFYADGGMDIKKDSMVETIQFKTKQDIGQQFVSEWLQPGVCDVTGDGIVNMEDFSYLAGHIQ